VAESITALLAAGARDLGGGHAWAICPRRTQETKSPAVLGVFVIDAVSTAEKDWPHLGVISVAPLIAAAIKRFLADGSLEKLYKERPLSNAGMG
jgi:ribose-phosphate pyrophosphokinase